MKNRFTPVADTKALEDLLARSHNEPVILFKHSSTCPISAAAYAEMSQVSNDISLVVVQGARDISREIEARTGIQHESPQAIILRNGRAVWNASHWSIRANAVEDAVRQYA
ncbi:MAG TPA: bacillithiol system redox-active protein YtxJ [Pyrinomonadaceae bacterium]|nr:bacillithiol system redox-active protein YtxJ [Pyrinomonadaceae bacterium]